MWLAATGDTSAGTAGNIVAENGRGFVYDGENRMTQATIPSTVPGNPAAVTTFAYDGEGRRVWKATGGTTVTYVYGPDGALAAQYGGAPAPTALQGTLYMARDQVGSVRLVTKAGVAVGCHDYLPFGEEIQAGTWARPAAGGCFGAADSVVRFTGVCSAQFVSCDKW